MMAAAVRAGGEEPNRAGGKCIAATRDYFWRAFFLVGQE